jgi:hypothetical protein
MNKAVKMNIYKTMVKPAVVYGSEILPMTKTEMKTEYMGEENIKDDTWTNGSARNMENKN